MTFQFSELEPITEPRVNHPLLREFQSHLTRSQFNYYCGFNDLTTNLHEGTHGLQAIRLRNRLGAKLSDGFYVRDVRYGKTVALSQIGRPVKTHHGTPEAKMTAMGSGLNAFYVYENKYVWYDEPDFRKRDVIEFVPQRWRNHHLFKTYVSGAPAWDNQPLYLWDEWTAYCNGAKAGESNSEIEFATIFGWFAYAVLEACKKYDPEARYILFPFFEWQMFRLSDVVVEHGTNEHRRLYDQLSNDTLV